MSSSYSSSAANDYKLQVLDTTQHASPIRSANSPVSPVDNPSSPSSIKASTSHSKSSKLFQTVNKVARQSRSSPKLIQHSSSTEANPSTDWVLPVEDSTGTTTGSPTKQQPQQAQAQAQRGHRASGFVSKFRLFRARRTSSTSSATDGLPISSTASVQSIQFPRFGGLEHEDADSSSHRDSSWFVRRQGQQQQQRGDGSGRTNKALLSQKGGRGGVAVVSDVKRPYRAMTLPTRPGTPTVRRALPPPVPKLATVGLGIEGLEYDHATGKYRFAQVVSSSSNQGELSSASMSRSPTTSAGASSSSSGDSRLLRTPTALSISSDSSTLFVPVNGTGYDLLTRREDEGGDEGYLQHQQRLSMSSLMLGRVSIDSGYKEVVNVLGGLFPAGEAVRVSLDEAPIEKGARLSVDRSVPEGYSPTLAPVDLTPTTTTTTKARRAQRLQPKKELDGRRMRSHTVSSSTTTAETMSTKNVDASAIRKALKATRDSEDSREMLALYAEYARLMRVDGDRA